MAVNFNAIVIGSGFGGAVTACRLAEAGHKVLVLERGRRWDVKDYPRALTDDWIYDPRQPHHQNGWLDLRVMDNMMVAQGAGVGGGSLIYANICVDAPPHIFAKGWPPELDLGVLAPYYDRVEKMLNLQALPDNQLTERFKLMREGANELGFGERFSKLPLAVTFSEEWNYDLEDPFNPRHSKQWVNTQGQEQGTCVHLGNCDIGCDVKARNTLDLNYVAAAEQHQAEVRPLHVVERIEPHGNGYRVHFYDVSTGAKLPGHETGERIVLAAGSLGSTELLLRCRNQYRTLPNVSPRLGYGWSSNGDFLTPAFYNKREINPAQGPTITCAIDFLDASESGQEFFIEDGGFPNLLNNYLQAKLQSGVRKRRYKKVLEELRHVREREPSLSNVMPWFAQGIDAADGRLRLGRRWYAPWKRFLKLDWDIDKSEGVIEAIIKMHKRLSEATGAEKVWVPPTWTIFKNLITPHPLGGCNMGTSAENGVVDHRGRVFGYKNLYVADGAIIPEAIGRNPSKTIAALAERCAALMN